MPEDVAILEAESVTIAGHTCKAIVLDNMGGPAPTLEEIRLHLDARLDRVPRCRERLVLQPGPAWVASDEFAIADHVRLGSGGTNLEGAVARAMAGRLDRSRPLWDVELLIDVGAGRSALVWRVHHAMADGMTMVRWASELFWDQPPTTPPASRHPAVASSASGIPTSIATAVRTTASVLRELRPLGRQGPFQGRAGHQRQVAFARCRLDDLRTIEHAAGDGVTMNDVVLGAVAGTIRSWCTAHDAPLDNARVKVPVSMHATGSGVDEPGNRDSFMFVDLPIGEGDPLVRLRAVNRETRERKTHHDAEAVYDVLEALERAVPPLGRAASRVLQNPREFGVNVSNVPGPRSDVTVLGRRVTELYSVAEIANRHPLRIAAISLEDAMQFGLCTDPDVVTGVDMLAQGLEASVSELVEIAR